MGCPHLFGRIETKIDRIDSNNGLRPQIAQQMRHQQTHWPLPHHHGILIDNIAQFATRPNHRSQRLRHQQFIERFIICEMHPYFFARNIILSQPTNTRRGSRLHKIPYLKPIRRRRNHRTNTLVN